MSDLVTLKDVSKSYSLVTENDLRVLRDINLEIGIGETVAIMGPSGSGKSTLLNLIGALDTPTAGRIRISGQDLSALSDDELARLRNQQIGFIFQLHHLLPQLTVLENVLIPTLPAGCSESDIERAHGLLKRVGLQDRTDQMPGVLSGGERQRAAVVRALINEPSLILADEPTGSLDSAMADQLIQLLLELNEEQKAGLVMVTHSETLADYMSKVYRLHNGELRSANG